MPNSPIPVVVVSGFLGSGKTTLLNHLLTNTAGARIGVLVNDFGSINIDAMSVAGQVDSMVSMENGCLCCVVDSSGLDAMLARLARPQHAIDVIVIEASGLADPRGMIRLVLNSEDPRIRYGGLVNVVDAAEFDELRVRHPELDEHIGYADLVVLNKTDRPDAADRARIVEKVRELAGATPVQPASHGRIDPDLLFDRDAERVRRPRTGQLSFDDLHDHCSHGEHLHDAYETVEFTSDEALHPRRFMDFLDGRPAGLYRMKGFVYFGVPGNRQKFTVHTVGQHVRFTRSRWGGAEPRRTQLVLIGAGMDADGLREQLHGCLEHDPDRVDPDTMIWILRYLRT